MSSRTVFAFVGTSILQIGSAVGSIATDATAPATPTLVVNGSLVPSLTPELITVCFMHASHAFLM